MKKIITYNINGIRSALSKDFSTWLTGMNPDIICLQEIKASPDQFDTNIFKAMGYHDFWFPAQKKGYSGVAILCKEKPIGTEYGTGHRQSDQEGRVIRVDFKDYSVMSVYAPSGSSGDERQDFKMIWLEEYIRYMKKLLKDKPNLLVTGDFNICHKPIDIHNPVSNARSSGFLPEEREWMDRFTEVGFNDAFRHFNSDPHEYTWWSFRANARAKNLGWRIDYQFVSGDLVKLLKHSAHIPEARHSDHCPVLVDADL
ncbi:MAG: exodeoxyribonuclease III [Bacteroidetes bacterium]|nr:MAG: exodeoxyribonuclease III [Bacteroidota bacterium]REK04845.1 MAG: exodeoxyribonuclease III [Bacteroidota bacterium]REK36317.1 MAG: exodeoxyribonuclease III [Bacteroidota bacterium]REK51017.1 MAG: exodeoxyribonuclease III [Bacteroidota bacterium]